MKQNLLLVSAAMMLMASSAYAEGWVDPKSVPVDPSFDGSSVYMLYNPEVKGFIVAGNDWGTRACLAKEDSIPSGYFFRFTVVDGREDGAVIAEDSISNNWKKMFNDGAADNTYMDHGTQEPVEKTYWIFSKVEGTANYRIENVNYSNANGTHYLGCNPDLTTGSTGAVSLDLFAPDATAFTQWYFVDAVQMDAYGWAVKLEKAIADAKAKYADLDIASEEAVYANTSSTAKQLSDAIDSITSKVAKREKEEAERTASLTNPVDLSNTIINATFNTIGDFKGWEGSSFGADGAKSTCAERYQTTFDTYQDINELPNGVYRVNVDGFYRAGSASDDFIAEAAGSDFNAKLYGANMTSAETFAFETSIMHLSHGIKPGVSEYGGTEVTYEGEKYFVPNSMVDFVAFNEAGYYKTNSVLVPVSEGKIRIGVKNASSKGWTIVDNFGLTYYGNGAEAYAALVADYKQNLKVDMSVTATKSLLQEYQTLINGLSATTYAEFETAMQQVSTKKAEVDENMSLWAQYVELVAQCKKVTQDDRFVDIAGDLAWLLNDYNIVIETLSLTSDELKVKIQEIQDEFEYVNRQTPDDTDVSYKIVNTDFSEEWKGWAHEAQAGGNVAADKNAKCAEAWNNGGFDIYQIVRNLPAGMYEIQAQGFYRYLRGNDAWNAYFESDGRPRANKPETPAFIYLNEARTPMANVFEYPSNGVDSLYKGTDYYHDPMIEPTTGKEGVKVYPNSMASAGIAFDNGFYPMSAYGVILSENDSLRFGMKGSSNQGGDSWAIFTRFKLIFRGFKESLIVSELSSHVSNLDVTSYAAKNNFEGMQYLGADLLAEVEELTKAVNAILAESSASAAPRRAKADDDTDKQRRVEMATVLAKLYAISERIEKSFNTFQKLNQTVIDFDDVVDAAEGLAREATIAKATTFHKSVGARLAARTYTDAEATEVIAQYESLRKQLQVPAEIESATDAEPVDLTSLIVNAGFEANNMTGWTNAGSIELRTQNNSSFAGKTGTYYAERWHAAGTIHLTQDFTGCELPAGTYELVVNTHCSTGDGIIYAGKYSTPITNTDAPGEVNTQSLFFNLEEGEDFAIGVKCNLTNETWVCVDDFKMKYYGKESEHNPGTGIEQMAQIGVAKVECFDLNGRKTPGLQQGINLLRVTDIQGNVKVRKVIVK